MDNLNHLNMILRHKATFQDKNAKRWELLKIQVCARFDYVALIIVNH